MWLPDLYSSLVSFFLIILGGILVHFLLPTKPIDKRKEATEGMKTIVLKVLLPAAIFLSLFSVEAQVSYVAFPVIGFVAAFLVMLPVSFILLYLILPDRLRGDCLSVTMLVCSFSPGLTSFPFIQEEIEHAFSKMAFTDFGNKLYGVFGAGILAKLRVHYSKWGRKTNGVAKSSAVGDQGTVAVAVEQDRGKTQAGRGGRRCFALVLKFFEPVTLAFVLGMVLSFAKCKLGDLGFFGSAVKRLGEATTPLTLLFVGAKLGEFARSGREAVLILCILMIRVGLCFFLIAVMSALPG